MKISELIAELEAAKIQHGDVEVTVNHPIDTAHEVLADHVRFHESGDVCRISSDLDAPHVFVKDASPLAPGEMPGSPTVSPTIGEETVCASCGSAFIYIGIGSRCRVCGQPPLPLS